MTLAESLAPEIRRRRQAGESVRSIAKSLDVGRGTVTRALALDAETETSPTGPAQDLSPAAGSAAHSDPASPAGPAGPAGASTDRYASLFAGFISEAREALADEPVPLVKRTVSGLLDLIEQRAEAALKPLAQKLGTQERQRRERPDRLRQTIERLGRELTRAQARVGDAEQALREFDGTGSGSVTRLRRRVDHARRHASDLERIIAWRSRELEKVMEDAA